MTDPLLREASLSIGSAPLFGKETEEPNYSTVTSWLKNYRGADTSFAIIAALGNGSNNHLEYFLKQGEHENNGTILRELDRALHAPTFAVRGLHDVLQNTIVDPAHGRESGARFTTVQSTIDGLDPALVAKIEQRGAELAG